MSPHCEPPTDLGRAYAISSAPSPRLPATVVVDHMGRPDVTKPVDGLEFELFERMMREHKGPERLSVLVRSSYHAHEQVDGFRAAHQVAGPWVLD